MSCAALNLDLTARSPPVEGERAREEEEEEEEEGEGGHLAVPWVASIELNWRIPARCV